LDAEDKRQKTFSEGHKPKFLVEPAAPQIQPRLDALTALRAGDGKAARLALDRADELSPPLVGKLNGTPFTLLRDCDDRFGTMLEVMNNGEYFWVPLEQVAKLAIDPPKYPRDLLWVPAFLEIKDGPAGDVFLPATYPSSQDQQDSQLKLGRITDWKDTGGPVIGLGLHIFLLENDAIPLLEWNELVIIDPNAPPPSEEPADQADGNDEA
jgi:type VI secretion system protein ImpE